MKTNRIQQMIEVAEDSRTLIQARNRERIINELLEIMRTAKTDSEFYAMLFDNFPAWVAWFFDDMEGNPLILAKWQLEFGELMDQKQWCASFCSRKVGKSTLIALRTLFEACKKKSRRIIVISPTENQNFVIQMIRSFIAKSKRFQDIFMNTKTSSSAKLRITLDNYSEIISRSIGAQSMGELIRGEFATGLVIDEIGDFPKQVYSQIIVPAISDAYSKKSFYIIGTPKLNVNPDLDVTWERWQSDDTWGSMSIDYIEGVAQGCLTMDAVEEAKLEMTTEEFEMEYCAKFPKQTGRYFTKWVLRKAHDPDAKWYSAPERRDGRTYVMAVDWGQVHDRTQILVAERFIGPDGKYHLRYVYWKEINPETNYTLLDDQKKLVVEIFKKFNCTKIVPDSTNIGQDSFMTDLVNLGIPKGKIYCSREGKPGYYATGPGNWNMWRNHKACMEHGRIHVPGHDDKFYAPQFDDNGDIRTITGQWVKEHNELEFKESPGGNRPYSILAKPKNGFMDLAVCSAMLSLTIGTNQTPAFIGMGSW